MAPVHVLDNYYLGITAIVTVGFQLICFFIAFTLQFDKITDLAGGFNFALLAILTLGLSSGGDGGGLHARQVVVSLFMIVWSVRLAGFLFFRILKTGRDERFDQMRGRFLSFLGFWVFQMLWVWVVSLPVTLLNSPKVVAAAAAAPQPPFGTGRDIAGVVLFSIGMILEAGSDAQKYIFRSRQTAARRQQEQGGQSNDAVCDSGFFAFSRHPNYFGEIIIQWAIFMIAVSAAADGHMHGPAYSALYASILGPLFITFLLLFVSGMPLSERPKAKARYERGNNWPTYSRWLERTSPLIPFPPQLYACMPVFLKRTVFLELPMYVFDPAKHSDAPSVGADASGTGGGGSSENDGAGQRDSRGRESAEQRLV